MYRESHQPSLLWIYRRQLWQSALGLTIVVCLTVGVMACQVPVFRYALERWGADRYRLIVLSQGAATGNADRLKALMAPAGQKQSLVEITNIDVAESNDPALKKLWQDHSTADSQALFVLTYPQGSPVQGKFAHVCPATEQSAKAIANSPVRSELIKRLTGGDSAVWLLLECGDKSKDEAAKAELEKQLESDTRRLALPSAEEMEISETVLQQARIKLAVKFSVINVRRDDPAEKFLVDCLLGSEPDLDQYSDQPMAFPVFGRGIVLYALVGKGIVADVISSASSFIVGPCSCQVKEQNPGFDLLLDVNWEEAVGETLISVPTGGGTVSPPVLRTIPPGKKK